VVPARRYAPFLAVAAAQLVLVAVAPSKGREVQGPAPAAAIGQPAAGAPGGVPAPAACPGTTTGAPVAG
jgi:mRNA-degrading endonuclease toxin of MazEF toxin-antitoxin module